MIQVKFTQEQKEALNYERYHHPNPRVQRKMEALWLKSQGESHNRIAELTGISKNAVTQYPVMMYLVLLLSMRVSKFIG